MALRLLILLGVAFLDSGDEFGEFGLVFRADFCDGKDGGCLDSKVSTVSERRLFERLAFLCTTVPNLALPFTIAYGTPIFRHSAGRKITNSIGSTSLGINTNAAFLFSIKPTTWFSPYFTAYGFLLTSSFFFPSLTAVASLSSRSFFSALVSGRYLLRSLKAWAAVLRSRWLVNWAIAGGTLRRRLRIFFWRSGLVN